MITSEENETVHITLLLEKAMVGNNGALNQVWDRLHGEIHNMAESIMRGESPTPMIQTTVLVNEAFIKIFEGNIPKFESRRHFINLVRKSMKSYCIDRARMRKSKKRGGDHVRKNLDSVCEAFSTYNKSISEDATMLRTALEKLKHEEPRKAEVLELFAEGWTKQQIASFKKISISTVHRDIKVGTLQLRQFYEQQ